MVFIPASQIFRTASRIWSRVSRYQANRVFRRFRPQY